MSEIPDNVWVVGKARNPETHKTPIKTSGGEGLAPLTVVDPDGERALPLFTTRDKAERYILHFMSEEDRADGPIGPALWAHSWRNSFWIHRRRLP